MVIEGSCHCRNIRFTLTWESGPATIPARACDCSFCMKHGGLWTSNPAGELRVMMSDPGSVSRYRFGTGTADFHVCGRCGIAPVVSSEIDGQVFAVVSVRAFDNVDRSLIQEAPVSFDAEGTGDRLARRKLHWIGNVRFEA